MRLFTASLSILYLDSMTSEINNFLLTEREGRTGEYWPEGRGSTDRAQRGPYKTTEGQYSPVRLELARLVSSLLYGTLGRCLFVFC